MTNLRLEILKAQTEAFLYLYYPVIFLVLFERVTKKSISDCSTSAKLAETEEDWNSFLRIPIFFYAVWYHDIIVFSISLPELLVTTEE